jgi:hypothetical protein
LSYKKKRQSEGGGEESWIDSYLGTFSSQQKIKESIVQEPVYGNIGNFTGQDWSDMPCSSSLFGFVFSIRTGGA